MRILYTTHQFFPEYASGTEVLTLTTARMFQKKGHDVSILTGFPLKAGIPHDSGRNFDQYTYQGITVDRYYHSNRLSTNEQSPMALDYNNLIVKAFVEERLKELKPDLVHCYHLQRLSMSVVDACRQMGIPVIFSVTDFWPICPVNQLLLPDGNLCNGPDHQGANCLKHLVSIYTGNAKIISRVPDAVFGSINRAVPFLSRIENRFSPMVMDLKNRPSFMKQAFNRVSRVVVATRFMEKMLIDFGVSSHKIVKIGFGIRTSNRVNKEPNVKGTLRLGFIGTLYHHKGAHILLNAFRLLPADADIQLKIYGDLTFFPDYAKYLKVLASGDPRVKFCGTFPHEKIQSILSGIDVLIVPSIWYENTPLVIHSALAEGLPVIATRLGGMSEIVRHGKNGFLFQRSSHELLGELILHIYKNRSTIFETLKAMDAPKTLSAYLAQIEKVYVQFCKDSQ